MSQVRISRRADTDLAEIWLYIAQTNPQAADRLTAAIVDKYQALAGCPEMGSQCEELAPRLRSFAVGNYVIFYRPIEDGIQVIRVLHGARHLPSFFQA